MTIVIMTMKTVRDGGATAEDDVFIVDRLAEAAEWRLCLEAGRTVSRCGGFFFL